MPGFVTRPTFLLPALAACLILLGLPGRCPAQKALVLDCADTHYQQTLQRMAELANMALPLVDAAEALRKRAERPDMPLEGQLSPEDLAQFNRITSSLRALYAMHNAENSFARDLKLLSGLFQASNLLHNELAAYVGRTGTDQGFEDYLATQVKMDRETYFYLELLGHLQNLAAANMNQDLNAPPQGEPGPGR